MSSISYYVNGIPYDSTGHVVIVITGGPAPIATNGANRVPIYTPYPLGPTPRGGSPAYDPKKLPKVTSYSSLMKMEKEINALMDKTNKIYPTNLPQLQNAASNALLNAKSSIASGDRAVATAAESLKASLAALSKAIADENGKKAEVDKAKAVAKEGFDKSVKVWKLGNMLNHPDYFDIVIASLPSAPKMIQFWEDNVSKTRHAQYLAENEYITIRNRVTLISRDVDAKKNELTVIVSAAEKREKDSALKDAFQMVADSASGITKAYGQQLGSLANEIASTVQGKKIRNYKDALATIKKIDANPNLKINSADRNAIAIALRAYDYHSYSVKLNRLSKAYGLLSKGFTAEKIYQSYSEGVRTGNWEPLMLTLESLALSGVAATVVTQFVSALLLSLPVLGLTLPPVAAVGLTILAAGVLTSWIDEEMAKKLNENIIPSAF